ncbi:MAG: YfhO family protein [Armatimonadota bacterium]
MHEALRAGRLPLWSPYIFCGYPIAAEGQIAAFYPLGLLISWLLPSPAAINWLVISHLMLAGVGVYLLARTLRLTLPAALLSSIAFSFSGYLFAHLHHISLICAAGWLPWVLLFVERAWRGRLLANAVGAALAWGACALCGHPQTLFHTSLLVLFWIAWLAAQSQFRRLAVTSQKLANLRSPISPAIGRALSLAALVFLLGAALASVQLLMTADLSRLAPHGEAGTLAYVTSFSLLPRHLIGLIAPNWQGTPADNTYVGEKYYWEYVLYIGLLPLALALLGATRRRAWTFAGLAVAALLLALAEGNPLYHLLRLLPGFADFRAPARYIFLFTFAAALLAGYGWETLASWRPLRSRVPAAACAVIILTLVDLFAFDRTLAPLADPQVFTSTPRVVETIRADQDWGRSLVVPPIPFYADWSPPGGWAKNPDGWLEARVYLPADVPQSFDLPIVNGYAGFVDPDHARFFDEATRRAQAGDYSLYSLVGARHFVMPPGTPLANLPSADVPPFRVYLNRDAFPRAFVSAQPSEVRPLGTGAIAAFDRPRPERAVIRARSDRDSFVVFNERWDPGWHALVDGRPAPLYETDVVLMGVPIHDGEHTVEFIYRPRGLIIGRAISLASLAACLALLALSLRPRRVVVSHPLSTLGEEARG